MSEKHTPGPWAVDGYSVVTAWFEYSDDEPLGLHHHTIVHDCNWSGWADLDVPLANARLIAAAPDMMAALRLWVSANEGIPDYNLLPSEAEARRAAIAAIAKAEGRQP